MTKTIDFWFDYSSPNAYFAAVQLPPIAARHAARLVYRPFFLGGLFKQLEAPGLPGMTSAAKAANGQLDLLRWSRRHGIPFQFPSRFPLSTVTALRATLALQADGVDPGAFVQRAFHAYWVEDADLSSGATIAALLDGCGHAGEALVARTAEPEAKQALKAANDDALAAGLFGAPSYVVDGALYFGKDRLEFVEDALR